MGADTRKSDTKLANRAAYQSKFPPEGAKAVKEELQSPSPLAPGIIDKIREDLTDAQRSRGELQAHLMVATEEVGRLQSKLKSGDKRVNGLLADKQFLTTKLKDRDEELRGKAKLLEVCFVASRI